MSIPARMPSTRVRPLRALSLVLAFTAAVGLVFGTAGFTAMEAERGLAVTVTNDTSAYLGYAPLSDEVHGNESMSVAEYHNQLGNDFDEFDVDVSIADPESTDAAIESVETPSSLEAGTASAVSVTLRCPEEDTVRLSFETDASGDGLSVSLNRIRTVTCIPSGPTTTGDRHAGVSNASAADGRDG